MAVADKLCREALLFEPGAGGSDGLGLDVEAQHPAFRADKAAEERRVAAVAAGGVDAELRVGEMGGKIVLHEAHRRQIGGAAADEPPILRRKAEFLPEQPFALVGGQGRGEHRRSLPVITAESAQYLF